MTVVRHARAGEYVRICKQVAIPQLHELFFCWVNVGEIIQTLLYMLKYDCLVFFRFAIDFVAVWIRGQQGLRVIVFAAKQADHR